MPDRRTFLAAATAGLLSGCAEVSGLSAPLQPAGPPIRLAPVALAGDRIIRRVVGLRPFRPGGFVVRPETLGETLVIHNYGHGGGGVTLSWGTAELALALAPPAFAGPCAVMGSGAVGLATARLLQLRGRQVTVYAKALPPDTTSNVAGAQCWPSFVFDREAVTPAFQAQYVEAARLAIRRYQDFVGPDYGVRWVRNYDVGTGRFDPARPPDPLELPDLCVECRWLGRDETPFPGRAVRQFDTMMIEPEVYLPAMLRDVRQAGGRFEVREIRTRADVAALPERLVFNCTGLGAKAIFDDPELTPVKGQLTVLLPQPEVTYNMIGPGIYMFPRRDGVLLGGTEQRGDWSLEPDLAAEQRVLADQRALFAGLRHG